MSDSAFAIDHELTGDANYGGFLSSDQNPFPKRRLASLPAVIEFPDRSTPSIQAAASNTLREDAEEYLRRMSKRSGKGEADWLNRVALKARKASRAQHLEAITAAYAASIQIAASPGRAALMKQLEEQIGRKRSATTLDLHLIVERFIQYAADTPAERTAARKLISRDVRAIQHLESAKVLPSKVAELGAQPGEGLDHWARQIAEAQGGLNGTRTRRARPPSPTEAQEQALIHEILWTVRRPDGSRKSRRRFRLTDVAPGTVNLLKTRLRKLGVAGLERLRSCN